MTAVWAGGANAPLSAAELLPPGHPDSSVLERLLRLLASCGVFSKHTADGSRRRYALTAVGRTLVPTGPSGASYADYVLQHHQDTLVLAWPRLHEAVFNPAGPEHFARVHAGVPAHAYNGQDREANEVILRAMTGMSEPFMELLLDGYCPGGGFEGVATLVDVGGSSGACLEMIMPTMPPSARESTSTCRTSSPPRLPSLLSVMDEGGGGRGEKGWQRRFTIYRTTN